jgi:NAD+ synthase (glutamine-hydrolysing)
MRIALAQINYLIGDFANNVSKIISCIYKAKQEKADLVVFAELSVCGYPPRDFLEFNDFIEKSQEALETIARECTGIAAIVGAPAKNPAGKGKPLFNSAFFLHEGKIVFQANKTLLPNYDVFDEYRYFEPNRQPYGIVEYLGHRIAITICEDLWNILDNPLYVRNPVDELAKSKPDILINIAASPFHYDQEKIRKEVLGKNAKAYNLPVFYVNHVGAQTELLFDGASCVYAPGGHLVSEMKYFEEDLQVIDLAYVMSYAAKKTSAEPPLRERIRLIHDALVMGIGDYFGKMGFPKAILGLSGGIDSAVTLVLAARALGSSQVKAVLLPSKFSSKHSVTDAVELAENLNVSYDIIAIEDVVQSYERTLHPFFMDLPSGLTEENLQARIRAMLLMAMSNKFGYILLNTSNKSEAAVGYGTLYGDMCGGISVLGDVYKTQVYELARYINRKKIIIPESTIEKPPSAELRPDQKDSDSLPEYDILDRILYEYIELRKGPSELIREGFDEPVVRKVLKLVNTNEYKRYQTPPILRVSPKAFGTGRRMPIVAKYLS